MDPMDTEEIVKALPKLEQHIHIVGSVQPETLLWLIEDSGVESGLETLEDVERFFQYSDFAHFIRVYGAVNDSITHEKYYERITYEMLESDARCNVKHVEALFSANDHVRRGLNYGLMVDAINRGIRRARRDYGITCTIRVDLVRNYGPEVGMRVLDWIAGKGDNIVAVDIGGSELEFPPGPYREVYKRARRMGLHLVAHAGEGAGPDYVWQAINDLGVERIGHGTAAGRDPELLRVLSERGIGVEACPLSNLRTNVIASIGEHPIREFMERGIKVSVNSDDPPMFNTDMNNEYLALHRELSFTVPELYRISLNALETSFLPEDRKAQLRETFQREYGRLAQS